MNLIEKLRAARAALKAELEAMIRDEAGELRNLTADEDAAFAAKAEEIRAHDKRIDELVEAELAEARVAKSHAELGTTTTATVQVRHEPNPVYRMQDAHGPSFFKDLAAFQLNRSFGDVTINNARERLAAAQETRAGDMTTVAGAGGEFAPPAWLVDQFIPYARAGRPTADLMPKEALPTGSSSFNLPKISGPTSTAVQATQNTGLSDTAMTTTSVSSGVTTVGGKQIVSLQLLSQSGIPFDRIVLQDLAADYSRQVDQQVLSGSGASGQLRGLKNGASVGAITFTSASPAVVSATAANSFYNKIIAAKNAIETARFLPAQSIIMHPQRWNWVLEGLDSQTRPLVLPNGAVFNALGSSTSDAAQGASGSLLGLPVYTDANIPVNVGAGTNQDVVYVIRQDDCQLWESPLQSQSFDATYADQASILFRVLAYLSFIPDRFGPSVQAINGTGLVTPTL